jgi:hypothetical protein
MGLVPALAPGRGDVWVGRCGSAGRLPPRVSTLGYRDIALPGEAGGETPDTGTR